MTSIDNNGTIRIKVTPHRIVELNDVDGGATNSSRRVLTVDSSLGRDPYQIDSIVGTQDSFIDIQMIPDRDRDIDEIGDKLDFKYTVIGIDNSDTLVI